MKPRTKQDYVNSIRKVQDFIDTHLEAHFSLEILSEVSGFSKYHFHRIFKALTGETLNQYVQRIKLEHAATLLLGLTDKSITEISYDYGFSDSAVFARAFKQHYGFNATEVREQVRKKGKAILQQDHYTGYISKRKDIDMLIKNDVEIKDISPFSALYLRHTGSYESLAAAFQPMLGKLLQYGMSNGLIGHEPLRLFAIYHDNHNITDSTQLKTSICMAVPDHVQAEDEFSKLSLPGGTYAIGHFEIATSQETREAWDYMYGQWLPESGLIPDDRYVLEMYMNDPNTHPEKKHLIDIYLPVKK